MHEGWLLVKKYITKSFEMSKDIAYITFLDLLDNLIPAVLDIYTHLFRENHFEEYVNTIFRLWTIMRRFQRHNYDKIMLAFLSDIQYWKLIKHPIINILKTHLNAFDEYPIENFHSLLRHHTNVKVTVGKSLRRDALFLDHCRHENAFISPFELKHDYPYMEKDLDNLVKLSSIFLLDFFNNLWKNPNKTESKSEGKKNKKDYYYFPGLQSRFSSKVLPLGYHSNNHPIANRLCDYVECTNPLWNKVQILICGHSYHENCFQILGSYCHYCLEYLSNSIEELSRSYNERLRMNEDVNSWIDPEVQPESNASEDIEPIKECAGIDERLTKKIAGRLYTYILSYCILLLLLIIVNFNRIC